MKENSQRGFFAFLSQLNAGVIVISLLMFALGWQLGHRDFVLQWKNYKPQVTVSNQSPSQKDANIDFKLFWQTWDLLSQKYIDKKALDPQKLYYGAIAGMVAAVGDPYTVFLPPEAQKTTKEQLGGAFEGVGIQLGYNKDKRLVVVAPLKGTPAEKVGVRAGDIILEINGKDSSGLSLPEAVVKIRGPKGSTVKLSLLSDGDVKPHEVQLTRDTIVVKTVEYEAKTTKSGKKIAYIRLSSFGEKTKEEWDEAVSKALADAPQGVIVDERNNPGGYLEDSVYVASEFLSGGDIVLQEDSQGNRQSQGVMRVGKMLKLPLAVLINKGSASASEILAGAIQDRKRGTLIGEQSFGKGTIQTTEDLPQGTGIHITTAKWLTPNAHWVHGVGLTPDVKVELTEEQIKELSTVNGTGQETKIDPQLEKALEVLDNQ
ncbi:MAG: S41 family peptidase [bacterium]|nr:S41 family peptidase [bacterium]